VEKLDLPLFPARVAALALGSFGILGLFLAATGIYGVMAYAVARRTREIGIRIAIGASRRQVLDTVLRRAVGMIGAGTLIGLLGSLAVARLLARLLYGIDPADLSTLGITLGLMAAIGLLACWVPARRAIGIAPTQALRED